MKGKVETVLGPVDPEALGFALTHEHMGMNIANVFYTKSQCRSQMENETITLKNLGWIRQHPYSSITNMEMSGPEVDVEIFRDLQRFKKLGGGTLVENTPCGFDRNFELMKKVSREIGLHIIAGTGYYVDKAQTEWTKSLTEEKLCDVMLQEIQSGALPCPDVKCGILGEIGISWPTTDFERKSIRSSAMVESMTGCPVMIHPGRGPESPEEIIRIFTEAGGRANRVVMAHLDRTIHKLDDLVEFASMGTYLEYDLFGIETSLYQMAPNIDMPSDAQRIARIKHLIDNDLVDRILLSHDIHTKHRLESYGGHGFCHILETVIPMMKQRGITGAEIHKMTMLNPAKWLTFIQ